MRFNSFQNAMDGLLYLLRCHKQAGLLLSLVMTQGVCYDLAEGERQVRPIDGELESGESFYCEGEATPLLSPAP